MMMMMKLDLGKERVVSIRSSLSETSSNSVQNGSENFISTLWILTKHLISIHRNSLWKILRHYGIPQEIIFTIQSFYNNFNCRVGNSQHSFPVLSGVRQ